MNTTTLKTTLAICIIATVLPLHAQIVFDPTAEFSTNQNPNGVWSYGWMPTDFSVFTLYTRTGHGVETTHVGWYSDGPHLWKNVGAEEGYGVPPGFLSLHPGPGYEPSVLRWTAPSDGWAHVQGRFLAGDGGTMLVAVRGKGRAIWQGIDSGAFEFLEPVTDGEAIDFAVYGGHGCGNTPLETTITLDSAPNQPPEIWTQPVGETNYVGDTVRLNVVAVGSWPFTYQWRQDGTALSGKTNAMLTLPNVSVTATGDYTVVVRNDFGSVTSAVARVEVRNLDLSILTNGLVAYYPFDGNADDWSGNGWHGTLVGAASLTEDRWGRPASTFSFEAGNCAQVVVPGSENLHLTSAISLSAWFRARAHFQNLVLGKHVPGWPNGYLFKIEGGAVYMEFQSPGLGSAPNGSVYDGRWHHVVGTCEGTVGRLYVDGVLCDAKTAERSEINNVPFTIGSVLGACGGFDGVVDEVRLYDRALSDAEARALYEYDERTNQIRPFARVRTELAQKGVRSPPTNNLPVSGISVSGTRALVRLVDSEVRLLDISNPAAPVVLGSWSTLLPLSDAVLVGNLAYVASWEMDFLSTVEIVDFTDPAKPLKLGYYDTPGYAQELLVRNNLAYVADAEGGMSILDVGDPAWPRRLGGYDTKGSIHHVEVSGSYAYVPDGNWLSTLDVSDPANPRRVGLYEVAGGISSLKAYGTKLYVSESSGALRILDVSTPASIQLLGTYQGWGNPAQAMAVSGKYLHLAKGTGGLHVLDVSDPTKPTYVTVAWSTPANDVTLMGKYALVAGGDQGLVIYELQQHLYPPLPAPVISGDTITLTWATTNDVRLQMATNLVDPVWVDIPESENTNTLTLPITEAKSFFRLVHGPKIGQPIQPPAGMVAWWAGDEDALDLVGTYHGTLMGGATFAEGKVGQAFSLDGVQDYVALPSANALYNPVNGFTWDLWVKPERLDEAVVVAVTDPAPAQDYMLGVGGGGPHCPVLGQVWAQVDPDGGSLFFSAAPPDGLETDVWYHIALVVDFPNRHLELFTNGQLIQSTDHAGSINARNMAVTIGAIREEGAEPYPEDHFRGLIDEVHVFDRPLSASEISSIFNAGAAGVAKPH